MSQEKHSVFLSYMLAWLTTELFEPNSAPYDDAFEEIQSIERSAVLSQCQLRIARRIARANYDNARVAAGL